MKWGALAIVVVAYAWTFGPGLRIWVSDLWNDPNYGHGLILAPLLWTIAIVRIVRDEGGAPVRSVWLWTIPGGVVLGALAILATEAFTLRAAAVLVLVGAVSVFAGPRASRAWQAPLLAHLFLIPWPYVIFYAVTAQLQRASSATAAWALQLSGVPLVRDGNLLRLQGYQLEVVEACSGVRGILTLTALAAALAVLSRASWRRWLLLLALAIPTAALANFLRLLFTGYAAQVAGPDSAEDVFHLAGGLGTFTLGAIVLSAVAFGRRRAA